jgi:hypothetical protein
MTARDLRRGISYKASLTKNSLKRMSIDYPARSALFQGKETR